MAKQKKVQLKQKQQEYFKNTCSEILSLVISFFILFFILIFSLRYDNYYYNILETKVGFYHMFALGLLFFALLLGLFFLLVDFNEYQCATARQLLRKLLPSNWKTTFSLADAAIILYLAVNIISTLLSDHPAAAFWGIWETGSGTFIGRYTGLLLNLLYVSSYFIISRFWRTKNYFFELFLGNGVLVCLLGITDYFQLDLLHFRDNIAPVNAVTFMSTIGNINTYTAYIAMMMGFSAAMYLTAAPSRKRIWYCFCMVISFFAIIMGVSENAYLALGALFAFTPLYLFKNKDGVTRYIFMLTAFFTVILCTHLLNLKFPEQAIGLEGLFEIIAGKKLLMVVTAVLWLICGALALAGKRLKNDRILETKIPYLTWCIFLAVAAAMLVFSLYDVNVRGNTGRYGGFAGYLLFNDGWGTNRGYIWRKSMETFAGFSVIRKLFGFGPDTFGFITDTFYRDMITVTGQEFDSAHNEYLQFLVTIGISGLLSYLVFLGSLIQKLIKAGKENPYVRGILWAIICYLFQALVNINLPVVTPMLWLLMSCGMAYCRKQPS